MHQVSGRSPAPLLLRGVRDDHGGLAGQSLAYDGITGVHKADAWVDPDFVIQAMKQTKVKSLEWHIKALLMCFRISLYFWGFQSDRIPVFDGLTVFRPMGPKIQAITGSIPIRFS